jgi:hypothetical protein
LKSSAVRIKGGVLRRSLHLFVPALVTLGSFLTLDAFAPKESPGIALILGLVPAIPFAVLEARSHQTLADRVTCGLFTLSSSVVIILISAFAGWVMTFSL